VNINKGISFVFHNTVEIRYFVLEVPNGLLWLLFIGCCVLVYQFCLAKATTSFFETVTYLLTYLVVILPPTDHSLGYLLSCFVRLCLV